MEEQETGLSEEGVSKIYCYKIECRMSTISSQTSKIHAWGFKHGNLWLWLPRLGVICCTLLQWTLVLQLCILKGN